MKSFYLLVEAILSFFPPLVPATGRNFRLESSMAKYLAVIIAREVTSWAVDLFGGASIMFEHPIHKFPMDTWASSLGEGTQDVQKLIIFREVMKRYGAS